MKVYKNSENFIVHSFDFIDSYPALNKTQNMSTPTSTNPTTKVYNIGGNKLNHSAIKGIIWNILNECPHKAYLSKTHKTNLVQWQLLQILAIATGLRHQAIAITNLATNSYCAAVSLTNPMKVFQVKAFDHINEMIRDLSIVSNINTKHHVHSIANTVIDMLETLPNEGNQSEIEAANRLLKAYRNPIPTRPSSPENVEMEPIPIPAPKPTQSAWQTVINKLQPLLNEANKENVPPTNNTTTLDYHVTNWNEPSLMQEVNHLRHYLSGVPPPTLPMILKLTDNYPG
jgi:hypothetical protein